MLDRPERNANICLTRAPAGARVGSARFGGRMIWPRVSRPSAGRWVGTRQHSARGPVMPRDYIPASDAQFDLWLSNFAARLTANGTAMGFSAAEITSLNDAVTLWEQRFAARLSGRDAARAATAAKRDARRGAVELVRPFARRVQASPVTDDATRAEMGLTPL